MDKKSVFEYLSKIPSGKVVTYSQIAQALGNKKAARAVGNILHANKDPKKYPCYRVVNAKGELAKNYAFGGADGQKKFLEAEGVEVINGKVDLSIYGLRVKDEL